MNNRVILLPLAWIEGQHLLGLVDEFIGLVDESQSDERTHAARLTPTPYPDDTWAAAEFEERTREDLLDRRMHDARVVRGELADFDRAVDPAGEEALLPHDVVIHEANLDAWLRTLTAMRLVMASRLGIDADDHRDDGDDPRYGVYDWLGYRLDGLVQAADERDGLR